MNPAQLLSHFDRISEATNAIPRLRRFILDLAVRGKLVEQDHRDEPASELLKRIQGEKTRLVKEGKIKELKPRAVTDIAKEIYRIPSSWKLVTLGETVNSHLGGGTPSKNNSTYWDGDILWASVKDVGKGKYIDETIDRITEAGLADSSSNSIPPGSLIVVTRMGLGKVSINRVPIAINQDLRALSLSSLVSIDYHYIFFKTHGFEGTGLTVKGIKVEELLNIAFPLPPLAEQHRIVAKVDELMALCDRLEASQAERESRRDRLADSSLHRLNNGADHDAFRDHARFFFNHLPRLTMRSEHVKQLRQTILNLALCGKLVRQDPNDEPAETLLQEIGKELCSTSETTSLSLLERNNSVVDPTVFHHEIPNSWKWCELQEISIFINGKAHEQFITNKPGYVLVNSRFVSNSGKIVKYAKERLSPLFEGDIAIVMSDVPNGRALARCFIVDGDDKYTLNQRIGCIRTSSLLCKKYLAMALDRNTYLLQYDDGKKQTNLKKIQIVSCPVPLPPPPEQQRIVAKVEELMALCDRLEAQITTTQTESRRLLEAVLYEALAPAV